jgi:hypothetical protein
VSLGSVGLLDWNRQNWVNDGISFCFIVGDHVHVAFVGKCCVVFFYTEFDIPISQLSMPEATPMMNGVEALGSYENTATGGLEHWTHRSTQDISILLS